MKKLLLTLIFFFSILSLWFSKPVMVKAQSCASTVELDYFVCIKDVDTQSCLFDEYGKSTYYCDTSDPKCESTEGHCSSNDEELCTSLPGTGSCFLSSDDCSPATCGTGDSGGQCGDPCNDTTDCNYPNANCNAQGICAGSGCNDPDPTPSGNPQGGFDAFTCTATDFYAAGWGGDRDDIGYATKIEYYVDGTGSGNMLGHVWGDQYFSAESATNICDALDGSNCAADCAADNRSDYKCKHRTNSKAIMVSNSGVEDILRNGNPHTIYAKVINKPGTDGSSVVLGNTKTVTCPPPSSCSVSLTPATASLNTGGTTQAFSAAVSNVVGGTVSSVTFSSNNTSVLTMSPTSDTSSPYQSTGTSTSTAGSATVTSGVYINGSLSCTDTSAVTTSATPQGDCTIDLFPAAASSFVGNPIPPTLTASVSPNGGTTVEDVQFTTNNPSIAYPNPLVDVSDPYQTTVVAVANGSTTFTATANLSNGTSCFDSSAITIGPPPPGLPNCNNIVLPATINIGQVVDLSCLLSDDSGISYATMHYTSYPQGNYCIASWSDVINSNPGANFGTNRGDLTLISAIPLTWRADWQWDTTGIPAGQYVVSGNVVDIDTNWCTGNPSGDCGVADYHCSECAAITQIGSCPASCPTLCGQDDGCGGTCGNNDGTAPLAPTITNPAAGNYNMTSVSDVSIAWTNNSPGVTDSYEVKVYQDDHPIADQPWNVPCPGSSSFYPYATCTYPTGTSDTYTPNQTQGNNLRIAIRAVNSTCSTLAFSDWEIVDIDLVANISGTIYLDDNNNAAVGGGGICLDPDSSGTQGLAGSVTATDAETPPGIHTNNFLGSAYTLTNVPFYDYSGFMFSTPGVSVELDILNSDPENTLVCTCPDNGTCSYGGINSPQSGVNFFVNLFNLSASPWWQVRGGHLYGQNSYQSLIPSTCVAPSCDPFLSAQDVYQSDKSGGVPLSSNSSAIGVGDGGYTNRTPDTLEPRAIDTNLSNITQQGYTYFAQNFNLSDDTTVTQLTGGVHNDEPVPTEPIQNDVHVFFSNESITITPSAEWVISDEKKVIFVNGDITFAGPGNSSTYEMINVDNNSFIAFIASGNIIFDAEVGNPDPSATAPTIAGIFIADGTITVQAQSDLNNPDKKFIGYGSFIGWDGINLDRDFDDGGSGSANNADYAVEEFIFNPNLVTEFPTALSKPSVTWQEIN